MKQRIVAAGASGFIGKALLMALKSKGYETVLLSRSDRPVPGADRVVRWDSRTLGNWVQEIEGCAGVINLAGASISKPWTPEYRKEILSSRTESTSVIGRAIAECSVPPPVWVNASAVGFYGDTGEREAIEEEPAGAGFLGEVASAWERAMEQTLTPKTRHVRLRIGVVLGEGGGALEPLVRLTKGFLGGSAGSGRQWVSWIHRDDLVRMFLWALEHEVEGPFNAVSPHPVRNGELMATLRKVLGRPWSPPAPAFAIRLGGGLMGVEASLILESQRASSRKATGAGFRFEFEQLEGALRDLLQKG